MLPLVFQENAKKITRVESKEGCGVGELEQAWVDTTVLCSFF